jgi:hypothetical protein
MPSNGYRPHVKVEWLKSGRTLTPPTREALEKLFMPHPFPTSLLPVGNSLFINPYASSPPQKPRGIGGSGAWGLGKAGPVLTQQETYSAPQDWTQPGWCSTHRLGGIGVDFGHRQGETGWGWERVKKGEVRVEMPWPGLCPTQPLPTKLSGHTRVLICKYKAELWCWKSPYNLSHIEHW